MSYILHVHDQIVGLEQVICNSDGAWSGSQPACKQASSNAQSRYYCGEPTHIPNAKHNGSKEQVRRDYIYPTAKLVLAAGCMHAPSSRPAI